MNEIVIYEDGNVKLETTVEGETIWLNQKQMAELFDKSKKTISEHINNVFKEGELVRDSVVRKFRTVQKKFSYFDKFNKKQLLHFLQQLTKI